MGYNGIIKIGGVLVFWCFAEGRRTYDAAGAFETE